MIADPNKDQTHPRVEHHHRAAPVWRGVTKVSTTVIVAHRLSTIRNADTIAIVEGGSTVETGNHEELVSYAGQPSSKHY